MRISPHCTTLLSMLLIMLATATCAPSEGAPSASAASHSVRILAALPHDSTAFTQGLFFHAGKLYESTGQYGSSSVRITDPASGRVLTRHDLNRTFFGEGLTKLGNTALQLTWKKETGFIYDLETLEPISRFAYQGEGWGLAASGHGLVMSNGTARLTFLDRKTLKPTHGIMVTENSEEVRHLNELEWHDDILLANLWMRDEVIAIDPASGIVLARIDLAPLRAGLPKSAGVANGIAYDAESGRLFMTGKNWNKLFEVQITPPLP